MIDDSHSSAPMHYGRYSYCRYPPHAGMPHELHERLHAEPISPNTDRRKRQLIEYERLNLPPDPIKRADWSPLASNTLIEAQLARTARLPVRPLERKLPGLVVVLLVVLGLLAMWLGVTGCSRATQRLLDSTAHDFAAAAHAELCRTTCAPAGHCEGPVPHQWDTEALALTALRIDTVALCGGVSPCGSTDLCAYLHAAIGGVP